MIALDGTDHGDPAVLKYNGVYYLYHTHGHAIPVYRSFDLIQWEQMGVALYASDHPEHWAQIDLWAPEVIYENGTFYMYVTGAMKNKHGRGDDQKRHIGVATSKDPLGPFTLAPYPLTDEWSIDAHPFKDDDGEYYMYYNVRNEYTRGPNGVIGTGNVVDRMTNLTTLEGNPTLVVKPEYPWEGSKENTFFWNEGPFVKKHQGLYYQMYSAGFFGDETYGIYYATSEKPIGSEGMYDQSWKKWEDGKAILSSNEACFGPGHHVVVKGPNGVDDYIVHHGYDPREDVRKRRVYVGRFYWKNNHIQLEESTVKPIPAPKGPTFDGRFISSTCKINQKLKEYPAKNYFFETNIIFSKQKKLGGDALYVDDRNRIQWLVDPHKKQLKIMMIRDQQALLKKKLPTSFNPNVYHLFQVKKQDGEICIRLDQIKYFSISLSHPFLKGIVTLQEASVQGTIFTVLP